MSSCRANHWTSCSRGCSTCARAMSEQRELHSESNPVGIPTPCRHKPLIGARESEASRHAIGVKRDAKKCPSFLVRQQPSVCHPNPPIKGRGACIRRLSGKRRLNRQRRNVRRLWTTKRNAGQNDWRTRIRTTRGPYWVRAPRHCQGPDYLGAAVRLKVGKTALYAALRRWPPNSAAAPFANVRP